MCYLNILIYVIEFDLSTALGLYIINIILFNVLIKNQSFVPVPWSFVF